MSWWQRLWRRPSVDPPAVEHGISEDWPRFLERRIPFFRRLPPSDQPVLKELVATFLKEKEFWGSEGLALTDEMKVVVAAYACLLVLRRPDLGLYPRTREVILYPSHFGDIIDAIGPDGRHYQIDRTKIGETWHRGPVLLAWNRLTGPVRDEGEGPNTILHEFAHALDFLDHEANGAPPLATPEEYDRWKRVMSQEYQALVTADRRGQRTFLDPYGAENPAEFFAVVSEHFFIQPRRFQRNHRDLYALLKSFYRQDPASWRR